MRGGNVNLKRRMMLSKRMVLPDNYMADDETMMRDNNSSSFNFRLILHTDRILRKSILTCIA